MYGWRRSVSLPLHPLSLSFSHTHILFLTFPILQSTILGSNGFPLIVVTGYAIGNWLQDLGERDALVDLILYRTKVNDVASIVSGAG